MFPKSAGWPRARCGGDSRTLLRYRATQLYLVPCRGVGKPLADLIDLTPVPSNPATEIPPPEPWCLRRRPCFVCAAIVRALPSGVRGSVEQPPCNWHLLRPLSAAFWQGVLRRVLASKPFDQNPVHASAQGTASGDYREPPRCFRNRLVKQSPGPLNREPRCLSERTCKVGAFSRDLRQTEALLGVPIV